MVQLVEPKVEGRLRGHLSPRFLAHLVERLPHIPIDFSLDSEECRNLVEHHQSMH